MSWTTEQRQEFVNKLDAVDRVVVTFYRLLLGLVLAAILAVVVLVIVRRPWGDGNQGEWFYFTVAVLLALGWVGGQYAMLRRRQYRARANSPATFRANASTNPDGARVWEFRIGQPVAATDESPNTDDPSTRFEFSRSFEIPLASLPAAVRPTSESLACFQAELNRGVPIDNACRLIEPAYAGWNALQQSAYRHLVTSLLDQDREPAPSA